MNIKDAPPAKLSITGTVSPSGALRQRESFTYTVLVKNEGGLTAREVAVSVRHEGPPLEPVAASCNGARIAQWDGCARLSTLRGGDTAVISETCRALRSGTVKSWVLADSRDTPAVSGAEAETAVSL